MWTTYVVFEQHTIWVGPFALCDLCSSSTDVNSPFLRSPCTADTFPGTELNGLVIERNAVWSDGRHFVGENGDKLILVIRGEVEQFRRTFKSTGKIAMLKKLYVSHTHTCVHRYTHKHTQVCTVEYFLYIIYICPKWQPSTMPLELHEGNSI